MAEIKLGLIGGMAPPSTTHYYDRINAGFNRRLGGARSANLALESPDFAIVDRFLHTEDWDGLRDLVVERAANLISIGATDLAICSNTIHIVADEVEAATEMPLVRITDSVGRAVRATGSKSYVLLGTKITMERDFYKEAISKYGVEAIIPPKSMRNDVDDMIFHRLTTGRVEPEDQGAMGAVMRWAFEQSSVVAMCCTELELLGTPEELLGIAKLPEDQHVINSTEHHIQTLIGHAIGVGLTSTSAAGPTTLRMTIPAES